MSNTSFFQLMLDDWADWRLRMQVAKMEVRAEPVAISVNRENPSQVLVSFEEGPAALLDLSKSATTQVPCVPTGQLFLQLESSHLTRISMCVLWLSCPSGDVVWWN